MKYKHIFSLLVALNLSSSFASASVATSSAAAAATVEAAEPLAAPKTLNVSTLHEAYQDFLSYFHANPEKMEPDVQPEILFAQELRERDEELLALQMINGSGFDVSSLSPKEISVIHNCIRWTYYKELVAFQEDTSTKPWLLELIYQVFPNHAAFQAALKLAASDDLVVRRQGALDIYGVMIDATDVVVRRRAAVLCMNVRDADHKSFLDDAQLEVVNTTLMNAVADSTTDVDDKLFFADEFLWEHAINSEGQLNEVGQLTLNALIDLMHQGDISSAQKIQSAIAVIRAGYFDHHKKQHFYLAPETQRYAALAIGLPLIDVNTGEFWFVSPFLRATKNAESDEPHSEGAYLATPEQRDMAIEKFSMSMYEGRDSQKARAISSIEFSFSPFSKICFDVQKEVAEVSFSLLNSPFLSATEKMVVARNILNACTFDNGNHTHVATDEMLQASIKSIIALMLLPDFSPLNFSFNAMTILNAKNTKGEFLASPAEISLIVNYGITVLENSLVSPKFWLAQDLLRADYPELTTEQFAVIALNALQGSDEDYHFGKGDSYKRIVNHKFATLELREKALAAIVCGMADKARPLSERHNEASFIAGSEYATAEQKAAAAVVLGLS